MSWWTLITKGATIADFARQVYNTVNKDKPKQGPASDNLTDLIKRIEYLERNEAKQVELLKIMAEQSNTLVKKAQTAYVLAIVSTLIAAISIAVQFFK